MTVRTARAVLLVLAATVERKVISPRSAISLAAQQLLPAATATSKATSRRTVPSLATGLACSVRTVARWVTLSLVASPPPRRMVEMLPVLADGALVEAILLLRPLADGVLMLLPNLRLVVGEVMPLQPPLADGTLRLQTMAVGRRARYAFDHVLGFLAMLTKHLLPSSGCLLERGYNSSFSFDG